MFHTGAIRLRATRYFSLEHAQKTGDSHCSTAALRNHMFDTGAMRLRNHMFHTVEEEKVEHKVPLWCRSYVRIHFTLLSYDLLIKVVANCLLCPYLI